MHNRSRFYTENILYCHLATSAEVPERPMTARSQSGLLASLCECNNSEMKRSEIELLARGADERRKTKMATLEELRAQLDQIDDQITDLYQKRMDVCEQVGEYKVKAGRKVYDSQRKRKDFGTVPPENGILHQLIQ